MLKPFHILLALLVISALSSCEKSEMADTPTTLDMATYYPLAVGKYITYRLDSTVYTDLNTRKVVRTYWVQDKIDTVIKDNLGNNSYRIRRMIRSNTDTTVWTDNATFMATPLKQRIEYVDNNLRFIKLINPVRETNVWYGNSYINFVESSLRFYANWEYVYEQVGMPFKVGNLNFSETVTVNQVDDLIGNPNEKQFFYQILKSKEVYARGVGLVYKELLHETWQEKIQAFDPTSFGIRLTILNHNF